jgi:hypothetical protein
MAIIYNGVLCNTLEELELEISELSQEQQQMLINDFNGVPNTPKSSIASVTPRQMRIALVESGISLSTIESMIDSLPEPSQSITRITWEYSVEFQRNNPLLNSMAPALGLSTEQVDQLFQLALTL